MALYRITSVGHRRRLLEAIAARREGMNRPDRQRLRTPRRHGWSWPVIAAHGREKLWRPGKKSMVGWIGAVRPSRQPLSRPPQDEELSQCYQSLILILRSA
jgi:hypothetical protein